MEEKKSKLHISERLFLSAVYLVLIIKLIMDLGVGEGVREALKVMFGLGV